MNRDASELTTRVLAYLNRHIAWLEETLAHLDTVGPLIAENKTEELLEDQRRRHNESEVFAREHRLLLKEWNAAPLLPDADRNAVRRLADHAETLTQQLRARYEEVTEGVEQDVARGRENIGALKRGKDMLHRYRPGNVEPPGFFDKRV